MDTSLGFVRFGDPLRKAFRINVPKDHKFPWVFRSFTDLFQQAFPDGDTVDLEIYRVHIEDSDDDNALGKSLKAEYEKIRQNINVTTITNRQHVKSLLEHVETCSCLIHLVVRLPEKNSGMKMLYRKNYATIAPKPFVSAPGPLPSNAQAVRLPVTKRKPFRDVADLILSGKAAVLHGPHHSGKAMLRNGLGNVLIGHGIRPISFSLKFVLESYMKQDFSPRERFYTFISMAVFGKRLSLQDLVHALETQTAMSNRHIDRPRICLLLDEFQALFETEDLRSGVIGLLEILSGYGIPWVGFGSFVLKTLDSKCISKKRTADGESELGALPCFKQATFFYLYPFTDVEMDEILTTYEIGFSQVIGPDIRRQIKLDSGGHLASLMGLLRIHTEKGLNNWEEKTLGDFTIFMTDMIFRIYNALKQFADLRQLVGSLLINGMDKWEENIDEIVLERQTDVVNKRNAGIEYLLDIGVLSVSQSEFVGFTSMLIYCVRIELVFPRRNIHLPMNCSITDPLHLLQISLSHFDPARLTNRQAWNKDSSGPAAVTFQWELHAAIRDLCPKNSQGREEWSCIGDVRNSQEGKQKRIDLLVFNNEREKWAGFEIKVDMVEPAERKETIIQAQAYCDRHSVDIYVLNFCCLGLRRRLPMPTTLNCAKGRVIVLNITHTESCDEFTVGSLERNWVSECVSKCKVT